MAPRSLFCQSLEDDRRRGRQFGDRFTVVYLAAPGTNATRLGTAAMAAFAGFVIAWFTLTVTVAVWSARASHQQRFDS